MSKKKKKKKNFLKADDAAEIVDRVRLLWISTDAHGFENTKPVDDQCSMTRILNIIMFHVSFLQHP